MSIKDILVCVDPSEAGVTRLRLAVALAREHHAHLSAAYVLLDATIPGSTAHGAAQAVSGRPPTGLAWLPERAAESEAIAAGVPVSEGTVPGSAELAAVIERGFREALQPHAIEGDWHLFEANEAAALVAEVGAADLVVYGQTSPDFRLPDGFRPEDIIVASGRPMLVVPYAGAFTGVGRRVMVAWDGTREAARALHDAMPLMAQAEAVTVLTVRSRESRFERDLPGLDRVIRHLARHGIKGHAEETLRGEMPIAEALLSRAADLDIDLIVAGAYHHSQFREALVGGVSRALLDHMTVPVLMSH